MSTAMPHCPACGQTDQVAKVSLIYVEAIGPRRSAGEAQPAVSLAGEAGVAALPVFLQEMNPTGLKELGARLKPPAMGKELPLRPLHPDLVILVFTLVAPFFLVQIYASQPAMLYPILVTLGLFYGFYLWQRKRLLAKFERQVADRRQVEGRVKHGIERWMHLYYCAREDGVFTPGASQLIPVEDMLAYMMEG